MSEMLNRPTRVLVVDDDRDEAGFLSLLLGAAGYQVVVSFDGESALTAAEQFAPDACVIDINMPGMNGYELARRLRERSAGRPPVLATVTGLSDFTHLDRAAEAGFDLHFTKPIDPVEVAEQIGDCVGK